MHKIGVILCGICCLIGESLLFGQERPDEDALKLLIKRLYHPRREIRDKNREILMGYGTAILDQIESISREEKALQGAAVHELLSQLREIRRTERLVPKPLKLPGEYLTFSETISVLEQQSGHSLLLSQELSQSPTDVKFRFSRNDLTFVDGLIEVLNHYHLDLDVDSSDHEFNVIRQKEPRLFVAADGPSAEFCRINNVTRKEITGDEEYDLLRMELQMFFSPDQAPLFFKVSGTQSLTQSEKINRPEEAPQMQTFRFQPFAPEAVMELPCRFGLTSPIFRIDWLIPKNVELKECQTSISIQMTKASAIDEFQFRDWTAPYVSERRGLAVVTRDAVRIQDDRIEILMLILHSARGEVYESHRDWLPWTKLLLSDGKNSYRPVGPVQKVLESDGTTALRYQFMKPGSKQENWKLTYELPTNFIRKPWFFEQKIDLRRWLKPEPKVEPSE